MLIKLYIAFYLSLSVFAVENNSSSYPLNKFYDYGYNYNIKPKIFVYTGRYGSNLNRNVYETNSVGNAVASSAVMFLFEKETFLKEFNSYSKYKGDLQYKFKYLNQIYKD